MTVFLFAMVKEHPREGHFGGQTKKTAYSNAVQSANNQNTKAVPEETKGNTAKKKQNEAADEESLESTKAQLSKGKFINFSKILALV